MLNETSMASSMMKPVIEKKVLLSQSNDLIFDFQSSRAELSVINDCSLDCTKSKWISLDTNDLTGDHERFE